MLHAEGHDLLCMHAIRSLLRISIRADRSGSYSCIYSSSIRSGLCLRGYACYMHATTIESLLPLHWAAQLLYVSTGAADRFVINSNVYQVRRPVRSPIKDLLRVLRSWLHMTAPDPSPLRYRMSSAMPLAADTSARLATSILKLPGPGDAYAWIRSARSEIVNNIGSETDTVRIPAPVQPYQEIRGMKFNTRAGKIINSLSRAG